MTIPEAKQLAGEYAKLQQAADWRDNQHCWASADILREQAEQIRTRLCQSGYFVQDLLTLME